MDRTAFWHYLTFIVAPAPLTMFRGIFKLPAGHVADDRSRGATRRATQYWDCRPDRVDDADRAATSASRRRSPS